MRLTGYILTWLALLLLGCNRTGTKQAEGVTLDSVVADTWFTNLFMGDIGGFTGSDGTYSVQLPDGRTAWIFGDTFIDGVNPDNTRKHQDPMYVRNSIVLQDGDSLRTLYNIVDGRNASFAIPPVVTENLNGVTEDSVWFWPGDGYIHEDQLRIFFSEFAQVDTGMWGFEWRGTWLGSYALPGLDQKELVKLRDNSETNIHFGHAVCEDAPYIYVYGAGNGKPHAARFRRGEVKGAWEYFDGSGWQEEISKAAPMRAVGNANPGGTTGNAGSQGTDSNSGSEEAVSTADPVGLSGNAGSTGTDSNRRPVDTENDRVPAGTIDGSEQFSVFKLDERYVLLTQMGGLSGDIFSFTSETPAGPWDNRTKLYTTPLPDSAHNLFTYNALAHPQFTEEGMLLVSYNTNSHVLMDHFRDATIYRPRFVRIPLQWIEKK